MRRHDPRDLPVQTFLSECADAETIARLLASRSTIIGDPATRVVGIATYGARVAGSLSYQALRTHPGDFVSRTVICAPENAQYVDAAAKIVVDDPRSAFMEVLHELIPNRLASHCAPAGRRHPAWRI